MARYIMRFGTNVIPEMLFDANEQDAYEIIRRQNDIDLWEVVNRLDDGVKKLMRNGPNGEDENQKKVVKIKDIRNGAELDQAVLD